MRNSGRKGLQQHTHTHTCTYLLQEGRKQEYTVDKSLRHTAAKSKHTFSNPLLHTLALSLNISLIILILLQTFCNHLCYFIFSSFFSSLAYIFIPLYFNIPRYIYVHNISVCELFFFVLDALRRLEQHFNNLISEDGSRKETKNGRP